MSAFIYKLLIIYFVAALFFIRTGNISISGNYKQSSSDTVVSQVINNKHNNPISTRLLAVGMVTGEVIAGFTLAEVLITLLIIGVVSSIVIPSIINETQQAEYKTAWKKSYADVDSAVKRIMQDNGGTFKNICSSSSNLYWRNNCLRNMFANYMSYVKQCDSRYGHDNCFISSRYEEDSALVLSNGTAISFRHYFPQCQGDGYGPWCTEITVDVSGLKGPNIIGKDIFGMMVLKDGLTPFGSSRLSASMGRIYCTDISPDWTCSAKYLFQ